jgi:hypothetical protein
MVRHLLDRWAAALISFGVTPRPEDREMDYPFRIACALILGVPLHAVAQDSVELPTPEEYAERASAAEAAPLFQSRDPLKMTLLTDIDWIRDERSDTEEVDGTVTFVDLDGSEVSRPVEVRARGNFRRDKSNCNFPPLRLDFPRSQMEGTVFEGQNRLKLVTPCNDGRDNYQRYVYLEYLAYEVFQLFTPVSYRVRLVEITYVDIEEDYESRTKYGFLIESDDQMAERNFSRVLEMSQLHPAAVDSEYAVLVAVFNYMIGNTDWSAAQFHNVLLIQNQGGHYRTVPYDFDFSGAVNARYATVSPLVADRIRRVTQRLFRGFCRPELDRSVVAPVFNDKKQAIWDLYQSFELLEENEIEDALEFYEDFYEVLNDEDEWEDEILDECRSW